jgi:hypothetical protein
MTYTKEEFENEVHALMQFVGFTREEAEAEVIEQG